MQKFLAFASCSLCLAMVGCATPGNGAGRAEVQLRPTQGNKVQGTVVLAQTGDRVRVSAEVSGLTPGNHGFHIHEKGDCSAPDATSAGGHFNPSGKMHGSPDHADHHAGDMPQLVADSHGDARLTAYLSTVFLGEGADSLKGRSVVVHAGPDDFKSQPAGNSGPRVACGVIEVR